MILFDRQKENFSPSHAIFIQLKCYDLKDRIAHLVV
jgi:hypothetical protein